MNTKHFFATLLICVMIPFSSFAQQSVKSGSIQITIFGNEQIKTEITGPYSFQEVAIGNIILSNLLPGEYFVRSYSIGRHDRNPEYINQTVVVNEGYRAIVDVSKGRIATKTMRDENSRFICLNAHPTYDPHGHANYPPTTIYPPTNHPTTNYPTNYPTTPQMSEREFNKFYSTVKQASTDKNKLGLITVAIEYSSFNIGQIKQLMELFSFEEGKLDCAKIMVANATDMQNVYSLADVFSFSATKDKFFDFLKNNEQNHNHRGSR